MHPPEQSAIDVCHRMAEEIWCGQRLHVAEPVSGLNSETAIRVRLRNILNSLEMLSDGLVEEAYKILMSIDILRDSPVQILENSEAMLREQFPGPVRNTELLENAGHSAIGGLSRLIICQSIGARMGLWAVRADAMAMAKVAQNLQRLTKTVPPLEHDALRSSGADAYRQKDYKLAAAYYLKADQSHRGVEGLYKASISLWRLGKMPDALWAIRTCLLEELSQFPSPKWLLKAQMVESRLQDVVGQPRDLSTDASPVRLETIGVQNETEAGTDEEFVIPSDPDDDDAADMPTEMITLPELD